MEENNNFFKAPVETVPETVVEPYSMPDYTVISPPTIPSETPPFSAYQILKGKPYSADYFKLGELYGTFDSEYNINKLEEHVKAEIQLKNMTDTLDSYNEIVKELEESIDIPENTNPYVKIKKLAEFVDMLDRNGELKKRNPIFKSLHFKEKILLKKQDRIQNETKEIKRLELTRKRNKEKEKKIADLRKSVKEMSQQIELKKQKIDTREEIDKQKIILKREKENLARKLSRLYILNKKLA